MPVTRPVSSAGRALTIIRHCLEPWRLTTADFISVVSVLLVPPMTFATIPLLIESKGERRVPRFNY